MAGTAREEAERLVATVLAMAAGRGPGGAAQSRADSDDTLSGTAKRLTEGLGALGETISDALAHLTSPPAGEAPPTTPPSDPWSAATTPAPGDAPGDDPTSDNADDELAAAEPTAAGSAAGASSGDPWAAATAGSATHGPSGARGSTDARGSTAAGPGAAGSALRLASWAAGWGSAGSAKGGWATGSAECCVCPICRAIASLRDPSPASAERLATGAGDFASGVASLMRGLSAMASNPRPAKRARPAPPDPDVAWSAATHTTEPAGRHERPAEPGTPAPDGDDGSPWSAATRESDRAARATEQAARAARHEARLAAAKARHEALLAQAEARRAGGATQAEARRAGGATQDAAQPGRHEARPTSAARGHGGDVWAAATAAPETAPADAPRSADATGSGVAAASTVEEDQTALSGPADSASGTGGETVSASGTGRGASGIQPRVPASEPDPRTENEDLGSLAEAGLPADAGQEGPVAPAGNVDHDVAGRSAHGGDAAAEGSGAGAGVGDDARDGDRDVTT